MTGWPSGSDGPRHGRTGSPVARSWEACGLGPFTGIIDDMAQALGQPEPGSAAARRSVPARREAIAVKIYTRRGDAGQTGIWGGIRLGKDDPRVEAIGAVNECNAAIGVALAQGLPDRVAVLMRQVQFALLVVGSDLMAPDRSGPGASLPRVSGDDAARLE